MIPLGPEHADAMAGWMADPAVAEGIGLASEPSLERTRAWIDRAAADPAVHPMAILAGDRHIGNVVLDRVDRHLATARLSMYIGEEDCRGRGLAGPSLALAIAFARDELGLFKLWLTVHPDNAPARAAYRRAGFAEEGVLRGEFVYDGRRSDAIRMGLILRDDAL